MKLQVEVRTSIEVDIDIACHNSVDEVEKVIKDYLTWHVTPMQLRGMIGKAEVYLPALERGVVLTELEKNNP